MSSLKIRNDVELRAFAEQNAEGLYAVVKENYAHLRPFLHWVTPDYSSASALEFIRRTEKADAEKASRTFGIFCGEKIVGVIGFVNFGWESRSTEIGYWIAKNYEGKGIVTDSCKVLVGCAFRELELNRVEIRCATENERSRAIPERLDFKLEGVLRQALWRHTRFFDMAIYSLLAEEYSGNFERAEN